MKTLDGIVRRWRSNGYNLEEHLMPIVVTVLCLAAAMFYVIDPQEPAQSADQAQAGALASAGFYRTAYKVLLLFATALSLIWGIYAFTGDPHRRRSASVEFSYFFVVASFALISIPPLVKSQAVGTEPIGIVSGCVVDDGAANNVACRRDQVAANRANAATGERKNQWMVNLGGVLSPQNVTAPVASSPCHVPDAAYTIDRCKLGSIENRANISGGLVMPLPFVLIALFGGAISLSRRVPEIQKRSEPTYLGTYNEPFLEGGEVREMLMFQIMQFASAPLIAIVAYHVLQPEGIATSAALAFLSGFGSEAVLLMIRGVSDGLKPSVSNSDKHGAISGTVAHGGRLASGVDVCIAGGAPSTRTDENGRYVLHSVPAGLQQVIFSWAGRRQAASVLVRGLETRKCDMDLVSGYWPVGSSAGAGDQFTYVRMRLAIDVRGADSGSLELKVDGKEVQIPADGVVDLMVPPGGSCEVEVRGRSGRRTLYTHRHVTPADDIDGEAIHVPLVREDGMAPGRYANGAAPAA